MSKLKLYIGCSLTYATEEFRESVTVLKKELSKDFEILEFLGLIDGTSKQVFEHDAICVLNSDLFVAICDFPSLGLGVELGIAFQANKKTLILSKKDVKVSRMILGMQGGSIGLMEYQHTDEIVDIIRQY